MEVLHVGKGVGLLRQADEAVEENTEDASKENMSPVVKKYGEKVTVKIKCSSSHEEKHYIEWAEVIAGEK